jgi:hypothetical protein
MLTYAEVEQELRVRMQRMVAHSAEQQAQVPYCLFFLSSAVYVLT